jgi:hypothetical protein
MPGGMSQNGYDRGCGTAPVRAGFPMTRKRRPKTLLRQRRNWGHSVVAPMDYVLKRIKTAGARWSSNNSWLIAREVHPPDSSDFKLMHLEDAGAGWLVKIHVRTD